MGLLYLIARGRKRARKEEGTRKYSSSTQVCSGPALQGVIGRLGRCESIFKPLNKINILLKCVYESRNFKDEVS